MRTEFVRIYKTVHTWTGIITGMALFIAFYAGAITVFKEPLTRWATPASANTALSLNDAHTLIVRTLQEHPDAAKGFRLHLKSAEHLPNGLAWQVREKNGDDHGNSFARNFVATMEISGKTRVEETKPSGLANFIDTLHRVVGLPFDTDANRWFMGVIAILYSLALFSGVILLLPSLVKDFFALRVGKNIKRMWVDAHNVVGIATLPFHVVMALTAVVFAYHDGFYFLQDRLIHDGKLTASLQGARAGSPLKSAQLDPASLLSPTEILARVAPLSPGFEATSLQYSNVMSSRAMVRVWGKDASAYSPRSVGGFVALDPYSGRIMNTDYLPGKQDLANAIASSFFALHTASFGGTPVQWMYFLLGLAGAWLFYSGNQLWIESRRIKATHEKNGSDTPSEPKRSLRWMAAATVGICLGCICGISMTIVTSKWLYGHVEDLNSWHQFVYYALFFGSIVWAFVRGAAKASIHLLCLAFATTFAIPLTSFIAWLLPSLGLWVHTSTGSLGVDLTALVGALGFAWMARITSNRLKQGPCNSIWTAKHEKTTLPD